LGYYLHGNITDEENKLIFSPGNSFTQLFDIFFFIGYMMV